MTTRVLCWCGHIESLHKAEVCTSCQYNPRLMAHRHAFRPIETLPYQRRVYV